MNKSSDNSLQLSGHSDLQIVVNSSFDGVPYPSQFAAAKLIHSSSKPQQPTDSSRSWLRILLSGYVHPGPTTRFPCPVCARNVTGHGVGYLCNRSGWVKMQRCTDELRTGYASLSVHRHSTKAATGATINSNTSCRWEFIHPHTIQRKWLGNKLTELGEFFERHNVKVAVIQESKLSSNYTTPSIQNFTTV